MELAVLQPIRFITRSISISANDAFIAGQSEMALATVSLAVQLGEGKNEAGDQVYQCKMQVETKPVGPDQPIPYDAKIYVEAYFAFPRGVSLEQPDRQRFVAHGGLPMIYGYARDAVLQQTAMGPHGPFILPAVNLTDVADDQLRQLQQAAEQVAQPAGKPPKRVRRSASKKTTGTSPMADAPRPPAIQ